MKDGKKSRRLVVGIVLALAGGALALGIASSLGLLDRSATGVASPWILRSEAGEDRTVRVEFAANNMSDDEAISWMNAEGDRKNAFRARVRNAVREFGAIGCRLKGDELVDQGFISIRCRVNLKINFAKLFLK